VCTEHDPICHLFELNLVIVYHVLVDISRSHGCNYNQRSKEIRQRHEKTRKATVRWTDGTIGASVGALGTLRSRQNEVDTIRWSDVQFLDAPDELQRWSSEVSSTGWTGDLSGDTIDLSDASFESRQRHAKTGASAPDELTAEQQFIQRSRRWDNKVLVRSHLAPDDRTHRRYIALEQLYQQICND
jgi:hypothetical protein